MPSDCLSSMESDGKVGQPDRKTSAQSGPAKKSQEIRPHINVQHVQRHT